MRVIGRSFSLILALTLTQAAWRATASAQTADRPRVYGIAYVTFRVSQFAPADTFYRGWLGLAGRLAGECRAYRVGSRQEILLEASLAAGQDERLVSLGLITDAPDRLRAYLQAKGVAVADGLRCGQPVLRVADPEGHVLEFIGSPAGQNALAPGWIGRRILHVGLTVRDVAAMDRFYVDVLGFSEIWRGGRTDAVVDWINMKVSDGTEYIEYMLTGTEPITRARLGTLHHVALLVDDMQVAYESVLERVPRERWKDVGSPRVGRNRRWQLNLFDPDGTRTELMEGFPIR